MAALTPIKNMNNPILWMETIHQERNAPRTKWHGLAAGIILTVMLIGAPLWLLLYGDGYAAMQIAIFTVWGVQAVTAIRAIVAGANTISREHVGQTWDTLVLTGVSARQILFGKWRAVLRRVAPWMLALGAIRMVLIPIFSVGIIKTYATVYYGRSSYVYNRSPDYPEMTWVPWAWFLAVIAAVALTGLEMLCCTTLGLAASGLTRRAMSATVLAILVRFVPVMLFSAFVRYQLGPTYFWRWWGRTEFSLSDAGTSAMMVLGLPDMPWTHDDHLSALPGLFLAMLLVTGLFILALITTWVIIRRAGALPQPRPDDIKSVNYYGKTSA